MNTAFPFRRKWSPSLWSARLESYLSTHAFELLTVITYITALSLMFVWGAHDEFHNQSPDTNLRWYISIARGAGYTLNLNTALVILLASRLFFTFIRDTPLHKILPVDKSFPAFHILVGYTIAASLFIHVPFHFTWIIAYDKWSAGLWDFTMSAVTGVVLLLIFIIMFMFALPFYRKKYFRLFYISHMVGALLFFPLLIFHGMYRRVPETYKWVALPLVIYILDRIARRFKISTVQLKLTSEHSALKGKDILELRIPKPFTYRAGQYAEIRVPSLSREWHPFTIASAPHEKCMCFFIKSLGNWTKELRGAFQNRMEGEDPNPLLVQVRGPFGAPAQHVASYERVVLISGGVGSTPFAAISKSLHFLNKNKTCPSTDFSKTNLSEMKHIEQRISATISAVYDIDLANSSDEPESEEQRKQYITDMMNLTAQNSEELDVSTSRTSEQCISSRSCPNIGDGLRILDVENQLEESSVSSMSTCDDEEDYSSDFSEEMRLEKELASRKRKMARQKIAHLYERRSILFSFLHTTRVTLALQLSLIARIVLVCIVSIFNIGEFNFGNSRIGAKWVIGADAVLSVLHAVTLTLTILLEISFMGPRFFRSSWQFIDFFVFVPLSILCSVSGVLSWTGTEMSGTLVFLHFIVLLPIMLIFMSARLYRSIRSLNLFHDRKCNPNCACGKKIPDVDFIWTTRHTVDDQWLREELYPLEDGTKLRLHRYITGKESEDFESAETFITTSNIGRPPWDEIFAKIAQKSPSHAEIGVFFCGPHAMGAAVRKSMRKTEIRSNLRGAYLETTNVVDLVADLLLRNTDHAAELRRHGCNIRFVFREENFG